MKSSQFDVFGGLSKFVMNESERLGNELRKQGTEDLHDTEFLKMQINQLLAEKQKLEQTNEILKLRVVQRMMLVFVLYMIDNSIKIMTIYLSVYLLIVVLQIFLTNIK